MTNIKFLGMKTKHSVQKCDGTRKAVITSELSSWEHRFSFSLASRRSEWKLHPFFKKSIPKYLHKVLSTAIFEQTPMSNCRFIYNYKLGATLHQDLKIGTG